VQSILKENLRLVLLSPEDMKADTITRTCNYARDNMDSVIESSYVLVLSVERPVSWRRSISTTT